MHFTNESPFLSPNPYPQVHDFSISKKQVHDELSREATHLIARIIALDCVSTQTPSGTNSSTSAE